MKIDYELFEDKVNKISNYILSDEDNYIPSVFTSYMNKHGNKMLSYIKEHKDDKFNGIEHTLSDVLFILDDTLSNSTIDREIALDNLIDAIVLLYLTIERSKS